MTDWITKRVPNESSFFFLWLGWAATYLEPHCCFTAALELLGLQLLSVVTIYWYLGISRDLLDPFVGSIFDDGRHESLFCCHCNRNMD